MTDELAKQSREVLDIAILFSNTESQLLESMYNFWDFDFRIKVISERGYEDVLHCNRVWYSIDCNCLAISIKRSKVNLLEDTVKWILCDQPKRFYPEETPCGNDNRKANIKTIIKVVEWLGYD